MTSEDARLVNWAALVAVTTAFTGEVTVGATKRPSLEIVPALADQLTAVLLVDLRVAVNCCFPPEKTVDVEGVTFTLTFAGLD